MNVLCDALFLLQISKRKLEFTSEFWVFSSQRETTCWLSIFMLSQPSQTILWNDRSGPWFQSCAGGLKRKKIQKQWSFGLFC